MNIRLMRLIDRFAGIPLCWIVGMARQVFGKLRLQPRTKEIADILFIKFFGVGSILLATPSLALAHRAFPKARVTALSFQKNRDLLERIASVDQVITIDSSSLATFLRDSIETILHLLTHRYDIIFDMEFFSKFSTFLSGISRAPIRAAFALPTGWRSLVVTHSAPLDKHRNVLYSFCGLVSAVSGTALTDIPAIQSPVITEGDRNALLRKIPIDGKRIISINVNAGDTFLERRWPSSRFGELVSRLALEQDIFFCFTGTLDEREYVSVAISKSQCPERCINTAGVLTIPELGALLERSELLISNDSGPLHLAASLGVPTVSLFGPESPTFYGALGNDDRVVFRGISCSPCMNAYSAKDFHCPYNARCMKEITVDEVFENVFATIEAD